jgi:hypothetical protein
VSRTIGPRFSGGYQFMRAHAARYTPTGPPIREERTRRGVARIVPLGGGRDRLFNVIGEWTDRDGVACVSTDITRDEVEALDAWTRLLAKMR